MKKLIIAASLLLSGCAVQYGEAVTADEVGKARIAAEQKQYDGEVKFRAGSGITYTRANNQCGNNCGKYAAREIEFQREQESKRESVLAKHQAEMKRQDDLYKKQKLYSMCYNHINLQISIHEARYYEMLETESFDKARDYKKQINKLKTKVPAALEQCMEYGKDKI